MILRVINNRTYYILQSRFTLPYLFYLKVGSDGMEPDSIAQIGDEVVLLRDLDYKYPIMTIDELKSDINQKKSVNWRSPERKEKTILYLEKILKIMINMMFIMKSIYISLALSIKIFKKSVTKKLPAK